MANEDDRESEEFEEFINRKEGSGQVESSRNPKGAGRPSDEWRDFKDFGEWKAAVKAGLIPRDLSELLGRVVNGGERRSERDSHADVKGLLATIGEGLGLTEKQMKKFDLADEQITRGRKYLFNTLIPSSPQLIYLLGLVGWYVVGENLKVTKTFTSAEWAELKDWQRGVYFDVKHDKKTVGELGGESTTVIDVVIATKYRYARPIHAIVLTVGGMLEMIESVVNESQGTSGNWFTKWMKKTPVGFLVSWFT